MGFPYVQSATDLGPAKGPRLAVTWHMAEGGGTVGFLSRPNPDGVSVHFVIEYTGRIVQMLLLDHMQSSIRTSAIRTTDDPPYAWAGVPVVYGRTAAVAVMGEWADIRSTLGPNHASIGVEMEGFATDGPNTLQRAAMRTLFAHLQSRFPAIRSLGHADFQDYKACPGHRVPWDYVGGHGPAEDAMKAITSTVPKLMDWPDGTPYYALDGTTKVGTSSARTGQYSPFGCGTMRAFYKGDKQLALVTPSALYPEPVPVVTDGSAQGYNDGLAAAAAAVAAVPRR